jgi:type II secretion system protein D
LEQIVSLDPFLKSIIIVNDGLSKNSVIVSGTKIQINALQNLLSKLSPRTNEKDNSKPPIKNFKNDKMTAANKTKNEVIASKVIDMRFTVAETVVATLEKILNQDGLNNKGSITAHAESNQLILVGKQEWINIVQSLILKIDRQPRQVYVDAIIAEISENSTRNLGLQFSGRSGLVGFAQGSATAGLSQGSVVGNTMLSGLTGGMLAIGGGASALPDLGALLTAIEGDSDNRILATPSLMTLENRESQILVGQNVPFITGQYSAQSGDQNASPFQTIQRKDLGISLKVKPRIGSNNDLILEIKQEVSGIDTNTTGLSDVATKKRELSTVIRARPGETIAIGGLRDAKTEKSSTKVPFFGDLPGIGVLFRQEMVRTINTNLVIFLRPTLMSSKIERIKMFEDKQKELKNSQENSTYFKSEKNPNKIDSKLYDYFRPENRIKSLSPQK